MKLNRVLLRVILAALSICLLGTGASTADESQDARIQALINQLSHDSFSKRERATDELVRIGLAAIPSLEKGAASHDREVRYRAARIVAVVKEKDFFRRLELFASGKGSPGEAALPGWDRYRAFLGEDAEAKNLFVDMQKTESELMTAFEQGPQAANDALGRRIQEVQEAMQWFQRQPTLGAIAAMLFTAGDDTVPIPDTAHQWVYNFCYQPAMQTALQGGAKREIMRKLLGRFIRRSTGWSVNQGLNLAIQHDLKEGLELAERVVKGEVAIANQPHMRNVAIQTIAKMGNKSHVPILEKLLDDTGVLQNIVNNNVKSQTLVCDAALAAMIHLSGQPFKDFGFNNVQMTQPWVFNLGTIHFPSDEKRAEAKKKWQEFREKQAKESPAAPDKKPDQKP